MAFTPRDVIVYLTDPPWKFLVKNHNGVVTRTAVTDYSKATNRRNLFPGGFASLIATGGIDSGTGAVIAPPGTIPSTVGLYGVAVPGDDVSEASGATKPPVAEVFTRVIRYFCTTDAPLAANTPYQCWDDEYRGLGDVDPNNELDE